MRKFIAFLISILAMASPVYAQVTGPSYLFINGQSANADEVNVDFANIYSAALNRTSGTMSGTFNSLHILPVTTNLYDWGSASLFYRTGYLKTSLVLGQTTANYTLTWANPASARAISIADPGGTDVFTFNAATQTLTNKTLTSPVFSGTVTGTYTFASVTSSGEIRNDATAGAGNIVSFFRSGVLFGTVGASGSAKGTSATDLGFFTDTGKGMAWMVNGSAVDAMTLSNSGDLTVFGLIGASHATNPTIGLFKTNATAQTWALRGGTSGTYGGAGSSFGIENSTGGILPFVITTAGVIAFPAYTAATWVAGDRYLVVNASGVVHLSAVGPGS